MMINSQNPRHISILQNMDNPFRCWYKILQECSFGQNMISYLENQNYAQDSNLIDRNIIYYQTYYLIYIYH